MASLQMMNSGFCAFPRSKLRESRGFLLSPSYLYLKAMTGSSLGSKSHVKERRRNGVSKSHRVSCELQNGSSQNKGEEPPESLFMKELRRRGITPASLLEETNRSAIDEEMKEQGSDRSTKRNTVATGIDRSLTNQREQSMALNSEGLEGLIPRAKLLLTLGGTFFMAFWPLILVTVSAFAALYLYFGPSFIHDASGIPVAPPQYIDPYVLLQDERMGQ